MMTDSQSEAMDERDRISGAMQSVLDELDSISTPAELQTVAEFARSAETHAALKDVLSPDELAELEADLERQEILADVYPSAPPWLSLAQQLRDDTLADNKANGRTAQRNKGVSKHRAGAGRDQYNEDQRVVYSVDKFDKTGLPVRGYEKATPERRKEQYKASKANRSPAQIAEDQRRDRERKKAKRKEIKDTELATMQAAAIA